LKIFALQVRKNQKFISLQDFLKKRVQTLEMSEEAKDPLESLDPDDMEDLVTFFC
jgi:hypothetical protein